jgi:hypothetical protein
MFGDLYCVDMKTGFEDFVKCESLSCQQLLSYSRDLKAIPYCTMYVSFIFLIS